MRVVRMNISKGIAKLLEKRKVDHFQKTNRVAFDDQSRQDYLNHFQELQLVHLHELNANDR